MSIIFDREDRQLKDLEERERELEKELSMIKRVKDLLADKGAVEYLRGVLVETPPIPAPPPEPQAPAKKARKFKNIGARRQILVNLLTGPTTELDLSRTLAWDRKLVREVLSGCKHHGLVTFDSESRAYLTPKGKASATFLAAHPGRITCPDMEKR